MPPPPNYPRREFLRLLSAASAATLFTSFSGFAQQTALITRAIPVSGEKLPVVGLGSWATFNVGNDNIARAAAEEVMRNFIEAGGRMIDSSPMYGSSQEVIGEGLAKTGLANQIFATDKVWISSGTKGREQMEASRKFWKIKRFDLMQVHNLLAWEEHLPILLQMKAAGEIRYICMTTSHSRRHADLEQVMRTQPIDFIQVTYNMRDREVEQRILPLAQERRIAVIANRPFQQGELIRRLKQQPLPAWAKDIDCTSWPQYLLKFIVSHPAITCAIPATTRVAHVLENMGAARGRLPDPALRKRMLEHVEKL